MRRTMLPPFVSMLVSLAGCGGSSDPPSPGGSSGGGNTITGRERVGWTQSADGPGSLEMYRYALYVNNQRRVIEGETCSINGTTAECSANLPALGAGNHSLEVAAFFVVDGSTYEGPRSSALQVSVASVTAPVDGVEPDASSALESSSGVAMQADVLARGLHDPVDLSVAADGRVFVAERGGILRIIGGDTPASQEDLFAILGAERGGDHALRSVVLAPDFDASRLVFTGLTTVDRDQPVVQLVSWRETDNTLGQPAVVAQFAVDDRDTSAVLRFGPDGLLYLATGSGGDGAAAQDPSDASGKILRLHADGTTPADNPSGSPVMSLGHRDPRGLAWSARTPTFWALDRGEAGDELNEIRRGANYGWPIAAERPPRAGLSPPELMLDPGTEASGLATVTAAGHPFFGDLIVASRGQADLILMRTQAAGRPRLRDRLLQGRFGRIGPVATGQDGAIYFLTANQNEHGPGQELLVRVRTRERAPRSRRN